MVVLEHKQIRPGGVRREDVCVSQWALHLAVNGKPWKLEAQE